MKLRLSEVALWTQGSLRGEDAEVVDVAIDSRSIEPGNLFVALPGEHHDGHAFVDQAMQRGAAGALVHRRVESSLAQVQVSDTTVALGDLASAWRARQHVRVVAITGSNGKTTVKTLLASILARHGSTHVTAGNFNNEIGLPLTLLRMPAGSEYAVLEMGAGKPGDIAYLAAIARPDIALVNNIAAAHLERMRSAEGVAETKGALYQSLPGDGIAVINADDSFAAHFRALAGHRLTLAFGLEHPGEITARIEHMDIGGTRLTLCTPVGEIPLHLPLPGRHNVMNAMAAAGCACALAVPLATIAEGLQQAVPVEGRLRRLPAAGGWVVIDDSYNANPASTAAAIDALSLESGERWLVLGDMAELGEAGERLHAQAGERARAAGLARLFTLGRLSAAASQSFGAGAQHFSERSALIETLRTGLHRDVVCLVKGSRSAAMEQVVTALLDGNGGGERHVA